jgi:hypothetical protein
MKVSRKGESGPPRTAYADTRTTALPSVSAIRKGVYVPPAPLYLQDLGSECWWLRGQPWAEEWLQRRADAWNTAMEPAA